MRNFIRYRQLIQTRTTAPSRPAQFRDIRRPVTQIPIHTTDPCVFRAFDLIHLLAFFVRDKKGTTGWHLEYRIDMRKNFALRLSSFPER